jgi:hypothetical protein
MIDLAICAIFRGEGNYLDEWISFHIRQGVTYFFLYNNHPGGKLTGKTKKAIRKYKSFITITRFDDAVWNRKKQIQQCSYDHCLKNFGNKARWIVFLDVDEFLFDPRGGRIQIDCAPQTPFIKISRFNYGYYPHIKKPASGGVVRNFVYREKDASHVKSIVRGQTAPLLKFRNVHFPTAKKNKRIQTPGTMDPEHLRINHYFTKSMEEFRIRKSNWNKWNKGKKFNNPARRQRRPEAHFMNNFKEVKDEIAVRL